MAAPATRDFRFGSVLDIRSYLKRGRSPATDSGPPGLRRSGRRGGFIAELACVAYRAGNRTSPMHMRTLFRATTLAAALTVALTVITTTAAVATRQVPVEADSAIQSLAGGRVDVLRIAGQAGWPAHRATEPTGREPHPSPPTSCTSEATTAKACSPTDPCGELMTFLAAVNHTGRSSMEVGIKVISENIRTRAQRHVNSCFFTMVTDEDGRPAPVPPLRPAAGDEQRRFERAVLRKNLRLELAKRCT
jgi:hypothetical protein